MTVRYTHLHLHSEYSLVDSTIRIKALVAACVRDGIPALALTDDSNMFALRSEEHTSELQSLMRISYAVFCLKKKKHRKTNRTRYIQRRKKIQTKCKNKE